MKERKLYENSLIIAPISRQAELLSYRYTFPSSRFKLISREGFLQRDYYKHDDRAIIALLKKGFSLSGAKEIANAFGLFRPHATYESEKLNALQPIFDEMVEERLLFRDVDPDGDIKGNHIVISGYRDGLRIGKSLEHVSNLDTCFDIPSEEPREDYASITACRDIVEECHEVAYRIAELISQGVNPDLIYLANYSSKYYFTLSLFAEYYGFSINFPAETTYFSSSLGRSFLLSLNSGKSVDEALAILRDDEAYQCDFEDFYLLVKTYQMEGIESDRQLAIYEDLLKSETVHGTVYNQAVGILSDCYCPENSHVFFLDFSLGNTPKKPQNPCYFSEKDLLELGFPSFYERMEEEKRELLGLLKDPCLEMVSYHEKDFSSPVYVSPLVNELSLRTCDPSHKEVEYSSLYCDLLGQAKMDKKEKFGIEDEELFRYYNRDIASYDNSFLFLNDDFDLTPHSYSYSALDTFYRCPFSYFVGNVLKFPRSPSTFSARVGTIFHAVLQERFREREFGEPPFSFEQSFEKAVSDSENDPDEGVKLTNTEKALLLSLKEDCEKIGDYIESKENLIVDVTRLCEFKINAKVGEIPIHGTIDKALFYGGHSEGEYPYVTVIDYKTYSKSFDEELLLHGLNMQLPIYALLLENDERFSSSQLAGVYFSPVILSSSGRAAQHLEDYGNELRLDGIFLDNDEALTEFGIVFDTSDYVAGTKKKKDGTYRYPGRQKSERQLYDIKAKTVDRIAFADTLIGAKDFRISPAYRKGSVDACAFCEYRAFCFRREKDVRFLDEDPLMLIGEEDNA